MATTTGGTTYVTSTDLVANYPTASLALANRVDVVASGSMSKKTASYTVTVADILAGTTICMNSASATVITLPSSSLVNGMRLNVFSVNTGAVTFTGGTVTGTVNSISAQYSGVSLTYDSAAAVWWCLPFSSGASAANFTNTATGTYTGYKYVVFTGNGTLTTDRAGYADIVCIAGGGGGSDYAAGGAGGYFATSIFLPVGSLTVTIGGGGAGAVAGSQGSPSVVANVYSLGGGFGQSYSGTSSVTLSSGGSGGGGTPSASATKYSPGLPLAGSQGFAGGGGQQTDAAPYNAGGGGGSAGAGVTATGSGGGGNGGAGTSNSIAGSTPTSTYTAGSFTYAGGGGGGTNTGTVAGTGSGGGGNGGKNATGMTAGTANTGGGGGGRGSGANSGANGGSGIVIVRVAV